MANLTDAAEFIAVADLDDIYCMEERGRRINWTDSDPAPADLPQITNSLGVSDDGTTFHFRFRTVYTDVEAEYVADWAAVFSAPEGSEVSKEVLAEVAERVAFFAVYPYLRASIYGSASRLNQPVPVLGLVRQGQFERGSELTDQQRREAFGDQQSERLAASEDA